MRCPHWRVPGPVGIFPPDILLRAKLDQTAKRVSGKLAEQATLGTLNTIAEGPHRYLPLVPHVHLQVVEAKSASRPDPRTHDCRSGKG